MCTEQPKWDWRNALPIDIWHLLVSAGWPGWEKRPDGMPHCVVVRWTDEKFPTSREMAVGFDDYATGQFYYRDYTHDGMPFVRKGENCMSRFWFQRRVDAKAFFEAARVFDHVFVAWCGPATQEE